MNKKILLTFIFGMIFLFGILSSVSAFDWGDGIVSYYKFDEGSGSVIDSVSGNDGTNSGATNTSGKILSAYDFSSDYIQSAGNVNISSSDDISVNFWVNLDACSDGDDIFAIGVGASSIIDITCGDLAHGLWGISISGISFTESSVGSGGDVGSWVMITGTYDGTNVRMYRNGISIANNTGTSSGTNGQARMGANSVLTQRFNGQLDEVGIWDRALSVGEIQELYNSGNGLGYGLSFGNYTTTINLISPENESVITSTGTNFTANFSITGDNPDSYVWKNATYYVWHDNGTLLNSTFVTLTESNQTNYTLFINNFVLGNYLWNVYGCYGDGLTGNCTWNNDGNYSFVYYPFEVNSETYQNSTIMGSYEYFNINISVIPGYQVSYGYLNYNGTNYAGVLINLGNNTYLIQKNISIPGVSAITNKNFHWEIVMQNGVKYNSTSHNQTVYHFAIDDCSVYTTELFNITLVDEDNQELVNATEENSTINVEVNLYSYDRSILFLNYSVGFEEQNPVRICLSAPINDSYYSLDTIIQYSSDDRATEFYNLQNFILRNSTIPQNITLYELASDRSTEFLITYKDALFLPVENALIEITRKYIQEGLFKTVEIPKTDKNGQAVAHLVLGSEIYKINVIKNGVVLASFDNVAVVCENPSYSQCKINLNAFSSGSEFTDYSELGGISYDMSFNPSTRILIVTFTTLNGGASAVNLSLITSTTSGTNQTICSDELTSSAGTLSCYVPESYGNITIISQLYANGELVTTRTYIIPDNPEDYFGGNGIIFALLLMLTVPLMFIGDKIGFIIGIILGFILAGALLLITQGSLLGIGSSVLWLLIVGGIGIWRISKKE